MALACPPRHALQGLGGIETLLSWASLLEAKKSPAPPQQAAAEQSDATCLDEAQLSCLNLACFLIAFWYPWHACLADSDAAALAYAFDPLRLLQSALQKRRINLWLAQKAIAGAVRSVQLHGGTTVVCRRLLRLLCQFYMWVPSDRAFKEAMMAVHDVLTSCTSQPGHPADCLNCQQIYCDPEKTTNVAAPAQLWTPPPVIRQLLHSLCPDEYGVTLVMQQPTALSHSFEALMSALVKHLPLEPDVPVQHEAACSLLWFVEHLLMRCHHVKDPTITVQGGARSGAAALEQYVIEWAQVLCTVVIQGKYNAFRPASGSGPSQRLLLPPLLQPLLRLLQYPIDRIRERMFTLLAASLQSATQSMRPVIGSDGQAFDLWGELLPQALLIVHENAPQQPNVSFSASDSTERARPTVSQSTLAYLCALTFGAAPQAAVLDAEADVLRPSMRRSVAIIGPIVTLLAVYHRLDTQQQGVVLKLLDRVSYDPTHLPNTGYLGECILHAALAVALLDASRDAPAAIRRLARALLRLWRTFLMAPTVDSKTSSVEAALVAQAAALTSPKHGASESINAALVDMQLGVSTAVLHRVWRETRPMDRTLMKEVLRLLKASFSTLQRCRAPFTLQVDVDEAPTDMDVSMNDTGTQTLQLVQAVRVAPFMDHVAVDADLLLALQYNNPRVAPLLFLQVAALQYQHARKEGDASSWPFYLQQHNACFDAIVSRQPDDATRSCALAHLAAVSLDHAPDAFQRHVGYHRSIASAPVVVREPHVQLFVPDFIGAQLPRGPDESTDRLRQPSQMSISSHIYAPPIASFLLLCVAHPPGALAPAPRLRQLALDAFLFLYFATPPTNGDTNRSSSGGASTSRAVEHRFSQQPLSQEAWRYLSGRNPVAADFARLHLAHIDHLHRPADGSSFSDTASQGTGSMATSMLMPTQRSTDTYGNYLLDVVHESSTRQSISNNWMQRQLYDLRPLAAAASRRHALLDSLGPVMALYSTAPTPADQWELDPNLGIELDRRKLRRYYDETDPGARPHHPICVHIESTDDDASAIFAFGIRGLLPRPPPSFRSFKAELICQSRWERKGQPWFPVYLGFWPDDGSAPPNLVIEHRNQEAMATANAATYTAQQQRVDPPALNNGALTRTSRANSMARTPSGSPRALFATPSTSVERHTFSTPMSVAGDLSPGAHLSTASRPPPELPWENTIIACSDIVAVLLRANPEGDPFGYEVFSTTHDPILLCFSANPVTKEAEEAKAFEAKLRQVCGNRVLGTRDNVKPVVHHDGALFKAWREDWEAGRISNFRFIAFTNLWSGRSYSDVNQYPVMPCVVRVFGDACSDAPVLEYRDLTKPMWEYGRREMVMAVIGANRHHSKFCSIGLTVAGNMLRVEPFANAILRFEFRTHRERADYLLRGSQIFDKVAVNNAELFSEFFSLPELHDGAEPAAELPPWARGKAARFVHQHRRALDSAAVRKQLPSWLQRFFGTGNRGQKISDDCRYPTMLYNGYHPDDFPVELRSTEPRCGESFVETRQTFGLVTWPVKGVTELPTTSSALGPNPCPSYGFSARSVADAIMAGLKNGGSVLVRTKEINAYARFFALRVEPMSFAAADRSPLEDPATVNGHFRFGDVPFATRATGNNPAGPLAWLRLIRGCLWFVRRHVSEEQSCFFNLLVPSSVYGAVLCMGADEPWYFAGTSSGVIVVGNPPGKKTAAPFPLYGHLAPVTCVRANASWQLLVSADASAVLRTWDIKMMLPLRTMSMAVTCSMLTQPKLQCITLDNTAGNIFVAWRDDSTRSGPRGACAVYTINLKPFIDWTTTAVAPRCAFFDGELVLVGADRGLFSAALSDPESFSFSSKSLLDVTWAARRVDEISMSANGEAIAVIEHRTKDTTFMFARKN
jgi:hypothetical protein